MIVERNVLVDTRLKTLGENPHVYDFIPAIEEPLRKNVTFGWAEETTRNPEPEDRMNVINQIMNVNKKTDLKAHYEELLHLCCAGFLREAYKESDRSRFPIINQFISALRKHLERAEETWGDTWLKRTREGQEERMMYTAKDYNDQCMYGNMTNRTFWLNVAGDSLINYIRIIYVP